MEEIFNSWYFSYIIVPILIVMAKIIDVSLGTIRIILVSKGSKALAPLLGFFEVLVWIVTIGQLMKNLTNPINYIAYAMGFSLGNYFGILIESKLALGQVVVRIITKKDASELIEILKNYNFGVTIVEAMGAKGPVHMIFTVIKRSKVDDVVKIIKDYNPKSFYSIEDIRFVSDTTLNHGILKKGRKFKRLHSIRK